LPVSKKKAVTTPPRSRVAPALTRGETTADRIYRALRAEIVALRRTPGQPISEKEVALMSRVSRTPVREALLRLSGEGLVEIFPQSGTFIGRIPIAALPEAILVRQALEDLTVRRAAEKADAERIAALNAMIARQQQAERRADHDAFHATDEAFHAAIAEIAGHPGIWRLVEQVKVQVDRYRRLTLPVPGRMGLVVAEHKAIVDAIAAHDPAHASAAMAAHLDGLSSSIANVRNLNPEFFDMSAPGQLAGPSR
jgi:DNA-binding GntR family transcriptional regulator